MQKLTSAFSCRIELRYRNSGASTDPRCDGCRCSKQDRRQCHRRAEHQSKHLPPHTYFSKSTLLPRTVQFAPVVSCAALIYNLPLVSPKKHLNPILFIAKVWYGHVNYTEKEFRVIMMKIHWFFVSKLSAWPIYWWWAFITSSEIIIIHPFYLLMVSSSNPPTAHYWISSHPSAHNFDLSIDVES